MRHVLSSTWALLTALAVGCAAAPEPDASGVESELRSDYTATVTTNPSPVVAGQSARVEVRIKNKDGAPVTQFDPLHTQPLHFIAVSTDLEDFIHIHPQLRTGGALTDEATFGRAEPYGVFLEYDPAGPAAATLSRATVEPENSRHVRPILDAATAYDGSTARRVTAANTVVEIAPVAHGMIMANTPASLTVSFRQPDGSPITDLTDWLEMPAHAIVVSPDLATFVHAHGMAEGGGHGGHGGHGDHGDHASSSTSTGPVVVDLTLPKKGLYKMFLQFQRNTTVITAPFVLDVMEGHDNPPTDPCATVTCPPGQHCMVHGGHAMCM